MKTYLIDGYNLIHALGMIQKNMPPGGLEASRAKLLDFLAQMFAADAPNVTVVFDAKQAPRRGEREQTYQGLLVRFAPKGQSADDLIESLIEAASKPKSLVVVSNDSRLQKAAERRDAQAWSHDALLDFFETGQKKVSKSTAEKKDEKTPGDLQHWLKEFGDVEADPELKEFFDQDRFDR